MLAAAAGGCRNWARDDASVRDGLIKAADSYGAMAAELLTEWAGRQ